MAADSKRTVVLQRSAPSQYEATNPRGGTISIGDGSDDTFTPVELLLAAIAGCSAIDVDIITTRRAEPVSFEAVAQGDKVRDPATGNRMDNLELTFRVSFPAGEQGDAARKILPDAIQKSHDRLCTVSRTVELESLVTVRLEGSPDSAPST